MGSFVFQQGFSRMIVRNCNLELRILCVVLRFIKVFDWVLQDHGHEENEVTIPPPADYDDGPESGYTTSDHDQPSSESDYSIHTSQPTGIAHALANHRTDHHIRANMGEGAHTLPPVLPERASKVSSNLPAYPAPAVPPPMGVPPPPSQRHITADIIVHQEDNVYETRLPEPVPPPPPMDLVSDELYGAQLPENAGEAYPGPHELYQTTLPTPAPGLHSTPAAPPPPPSGPVTLPKRASQAPPPPPPLATLPRHNVPTPPSMGMPGARSPESELPPPPPPINFQTLPQSTGGGVRLPSPPKMAPPTLPKPRKGSSMSPPMSPSSSSSSSSVGTYGFPAGVPGAPPVAPPPPGAAAATPPPPRAPSHHPEMSLMMPRDAPVQATPLPTGPAPEIESDLAAKLARVRLRADSVPVVEEGECISSELFCILQ